MEGRGVTTSGVVSFAEGLEDKSAFLYQTLSNQYPAHADLFGAFARESRMNKVLVTRTYQETVTDALEMGYSFEGLELEKAIPEGIWERKPALAGAVELERSAVAFYSDVAQRSQTLLSTIPSVFRKIAHSRKTRLAKLETLNLGG